MILKKELFKDKSFFLFLFSLAWILDILVTWRYTYSLGIKEEGNFLMRFLFLKSSWLFPLVSSLLFSLAYLIIILSFKKNHKKMWIILFCYAFFTWISWFRIYGII